MLSLLLTFALALLAGAFGGASVVWALLRRSTPAEPPSSEQPDEWVSAEIDQAAVAWATAHGRPEAAPLMADKLRLLHRLGLRRERHAR
jgi:hypothetical protein